MRDFTKSNQLKTRFNSLIPGGAHTYSKGDDQFPEFMAPYITHGKGCRAWDVDGNEFIEYGMGLRSVTLGHAYEPVIEAVKKQLDYGCNFGRPTMIEAECAEQFLDMIPGAEMVKFAKNGSDATTAAVKLARAYTGRDLVGFCGSHPFFSVDDWFIGKTKINSGIPQAIQDLSVSFTYNDIQSVKSLFDKYPDQIACLILEAERTEEPKPGFLQEVKSLCEENGTVLVFDEIVSGFRWHNGGAQTFHGVTPHLSSWGKALANGFAVAALAGKREIMDLGGIYHEKERMFLLSTTYGAVTHGLAAAMATMKIYEEEPVIEHLFRMGAKLREGIQHSIDHHQLDGYFALYGRDCCLFFGTRGQDKTPSQPYRTLFLQELLKRGIMAPSLIVSYSHKESDINETIEKVNECLEIYKKAIEEGHEKYLVGAPVQPVYRKKNFAGTKRSLSL